MKKTIRNIIAVCSVLCLSLLSLVSCKQPYTEEKEIFAPQPVSVSESCYLGWNWIINVTLTPDVNGIKVKVVPEGSDNYSEGKNFFDQSEFGWQEISVTCMSSGVKHNSSVEERSQGYVEFIYPYTSRKSGETFEIELNYGSYYIYLSCLANGGVGEFVKPSEIDDMEVYISGWDYGYSIDVATTLISPNAITYLSDLNGTNFDVTSVYYQIYPVQNGSIDWGTCISMGQIDDNNYSWVDMTRFGLGFMLFENSSATIIEDYLSVVPGEYTGAYAQYFFKVHPNTSIPEIDNVEFEIAGVNGQTELES